MSKPMSENKATIEERYEQLIQATVDGEDTDVIALHAASLITDLMAERGKMKERVELDELFGVDVRRRADYYRAFNEKGNQLEGDKSLQRVCAYLLRAYDPQPFILKAHTFEDGGDVEIAEMRVRINPITVEIVEDK